MNLTLLNLTFSGVLSFVFYVFIAILVLLVMVTIHEFGHFIAGRKLGFKINEFSVGFGKVLFQKTTKDGILVSLRLIPLGGYCAFDGEDEDVDTPTAFNNQKPWKRLIVLFNGAFFNFLSAVLFSFILLLSFGYGDLVKIETINPLANTDLQKGDIIYEVNGVETNFVYDNYFSTLVQDVEQNSIIELTIKRDGEMMKAFIYKGRDIQVSAGNYLIADKTFNIINENDKLFLINTENQTEKFEFVLQQNSENNSTIYNVTVDGLNYSYDSSTSEMVCTSLGVQFSNYKYSFFEALVYSVPFTAKWAWKVLMLFGQLITGQLALSSLGGPIATVGAIASYTQTSWANLLLLFPLISANLAVFNLLPFPALDGARMVFVLIEWIRKKPIDRKIEGYIHTVGLIVLFAFVIFVDIFNLIF